MNRKELINWVTDALERHRHQMGSVIFRLSEEHMADLDGTWRIVLVPDCDIQNTSQVYDVFNQIEEEIEEAHDVDVMLVPAAPQHTG